MKFSTQTIAAAALFSGLACAAPIASPTETSSSTVARYDFVFPDSAIIANETLPADTVAFLKGNTVIIVNATIAEAAFVSAGLNPQEILDSTSSAESGEGLQKRWSWGYVGYGQPLTKKEDSEEELAKRWSWGYVGYGQPLTKKEDGEEELAKRWSWGYVGYGQPLTKKEDGEEELAKRWSWGYVGYGQPLTKKEDSEEELAKRWSWGYVGYGQPLTRRSEGDVEVSQDGWNLFTYLQPLL